jgi:hypothetical protein
MSVAKITCFQQPNKTFVVKHLKLIAKLYMATRQLISEIRAYVNKKYRSFSHDMASDTILARSMWKSSAIAGYLD